MNEPAAKPIDYHAERCGHNFPPDQCPHDDCGYREALAQIAELEAKLSTEVSDWAETDTAVRNAARPVLGAWVDGDSDGVPGVGDIVEHLVKRLKTACYFTCGDKVEFDFAVLDQLDELQAENAKREAYWQRRQERRQSELEKVKAENAKLRAALELAAGSMNSWLEKEEDAPMSANAHLDEMIDALKPYIPTGNFSKEAAALRVANATIDAAKATASPDTPESPHG